MSNRCFPLKRFHVDEVLWGISPQAIDAGLQWFVNRIVAEMHSGTELPCYLTHRGGTIRRLDRSYCRSHVWHIYIHSEFWPTMVTIDRWLPQSNALSSSHNHTVSRTLGDSHPCPTYTDAGRRLLFFPVESLIRRSVRRHHSRRAVPSPGLHHPVRYQPCLGVARPSRVTAGLRIGRHDRR